MLMKKESEIHVQLFQNRIVFFRSSHKLLEVNPIDITVNGGKRNGRKKGSGKEEGREDREGNCGLIDRSAAGRKLVSAHHILSGMAHRVLDELF